MALRYALFITTFALCTTASMAQQCRNFVRNNCRNMLEGYVANESFNAARLMPGDEAEVDLTFYGGQDYRLVVCGQSNLPKVEFQILDKDKNVVFDNRQKNFIEYFDFRMAGTQNLTIKLKVPGKATASGMTTQGCVALLVGRKTD